MLGESGVVCVDEMNEILLLDAFEVGVLVEEVVVGAI